MQGQDIPFFDYLLRRSWRTIHATAVAGALAAILIFVGGMFGFTLLTYCSDLMYLLGRNGLLLPGLVQGIAIIALASVVVGLLTLRGKALPVTPFILSAVVAALSIYVLYNNSFDAAWVSDFQRMWKAAGQLVEEGRFEARNIIEQRAFPVLVPAVYLFGHNPLIVPVLNMLCLILIMLMGYDVLRRVSNHLAAQIFVVLWILAGETAFAMKIPSHDVWGLFFGVLVLWMLVHALSYGRQTASLAFLQGCLVGLPITLLEVQRELGVVVLVAFATTVLLFRGKTVVVAQKPGCRLQRRLLVFLLGTIVSFGMSGITLKKIGIITSDPSYSYLANVRTGALAPSYSNGTFGYASTFGGALLRDLPPEAQQETARSLFLSDLVEQPEQRFSSVISKMKRISALGQQTWFYQGDLNYDNKYLSDVFKVYNKIYSIFISSLFIIVLFSALSHLDNIVSVYSLAFMGVLIGGLVTIGEVQPRYAFPVWFFAPVVIATRLGGLHSVGTMAPVNIVETGRSLLIGVAVMVAGVWSVQAIAGHLYTVPKGRVITHFNMHSVGVKMHEDTSPRQLDRITRNNPSIGIGQLGFSLLAGDTASAPSSLSASQHVCADDSHRVLRFAYVMPYVNPKAKGAFRLLVSINDQRLFERSLPDDGNFHNVAISDALAPNECGVLTYVLEISRPLPVKSWVNATRTEVYFPRLARW